MLTECQISNDSSIYFQTFIFRGAEGFVEFTSFKMPSPIKQMIHFEITAHPMQLKCPEHYLIITMDNQASFVQAITIGDCRINDNLKC